MTEEFEVAGDINLPFYIKKAQASCAVDSMITVLGLTNLFHNCEQKREHYGNASERNRVEVWNIRLEMREAGDC